jgi:hypothetical protein
MPWSRVSLIIFIGQQTIPSNETADVSPSEMSVPRNFLVLCKKRNITENLQKAHEFNLL